MINYLGFLILFLTRSLCYGQDDFPIETIRETIEEFVPKTWKIIRTANGDLNNDKVDDVALVIQEMDSKNLDIKSGYGIDTLDSNPRILIVLLKNASTGKFKLKGISKTFILSHLSRTMEDPFSGIQISKGILGIEFHFWYSAGSWFVTTVEYKFKFQKNDFVLIGAEFDQMDRGTMETTKRSFNFLSKKMSETKFNEAIEDQKPTTEWKNLNLKKLKTLKTLTGPLQWTILPNVEI